MIPGWTAARLWRPLLMLAGLAAAGDALRELHGDGLADLASASAGSAWSIAGYVAIGAALSAAGLPRQVVAYAGGYGFGLWAGVALALVAQLLACAADFLWARAVARHWAGRFVARRGGWLARLDRTLAANPFAATVMLRLLPVGNNLLLNLVAGVSSVPAGRFFAGSAVGYLPQTLVFVLVGTGTRLDQRAQIALGAALFAASAGLGVMLLRRLQAADGAAATAGSAAPPRAATRAR